MSLATPWVLGDLWRVTLVVLNLTQKALTLSLPEGFHLTLLTPKPLLFPPFCPSLPSFPARPLFGPRVPGRAGSERRRPGAPFRLRFPCPGMGGDPRRRGVRAPALLRRSPPSSSSCSSSAVPPHARPRDRPWLGRPGATPGVLRGRSDVGRSPPTALDDGPPKYRVSRARGEAHRPLSRPDRRPAGARLGQCGRAARTTAPPVPRGPSPVPRAPSPDPPRGKGPSGSERR